MPWRIVSTKEFSKSFKKYSKDGKFVRSLEKKIEKLEESPERVGGHLSGRLHGFRSTRIIKKFRLVFKIDEKKSCVYLVGIDHRKFNYRNF